MNFKGKEREAVNKLLAHIKSRGGKVTNMCEGGSIYAELNEIKRIRISDHLALKGNMNWVDIIIQKDANHIKYLCIYYKNLMIYNNIGKVKQWIDDLDFALKVINVNMPATFNKSKSDLEISKLKNEITIRDRKCIEYKEKISSIRKDSVQKINDALESSRHKLKETKQSHQKYFIAYNKTVSDHNKVVRQLKKLKTMEEFENYVNSLELIKNINN